jgi:uncharacterized protein YdbL (DUF1318 family)
MKSLLAALGFTAISVLATVLYYEGLHLPFIGQVIDGAIAHRLDGYVTLVEKKTADAKAAEAKRQADINAQSAEEYRKKLVIVQAQSAKVDVEQEARISDYEAKLSAANRRCNLNDDDLRVIMHNGAGKANPIGKRQGPN